MFRNRVNNVKKNDEYKYKKHKVTENLENPTSMWGTIKGFMNWKKAGSPSQILVNNILYRKAKDVAMYMNKFFIQKVEDLRKNFSHEKPNLLHCKRMMNGKKCKLSMKYVSVLQIQKILKSLNPSRSSAVDELDSFALKISADIIARPVHHIITLSIMQKQFPEAWKFAKVLPFHKKGSVF